MPEKHLALILCLATGCATSYRPKVTGPEPFSFALTPEQCAHLTKEKRTYHATQQTASYVSGAGAALTGVFLGLLDAKVAPAVSAGATLAASGVSVFSGSQVSDLDEEFQQGQCR
jgi:hypothetical protein